MKLNDQLAELYSKNWSELEMKAKSTANITHPLLIKVNEEKYLESDIKVMIFGQETDGWHGEFPREENPSTVERLMSAYESYYYGVKNKSKRPFWNNRNFKYFENKITKHFKEKNKNVAFLWNNISKIGKTSRGRATGNIRELELKYLKVIEDEIEILKPDIVIFSTGVSRDKHIEDAFGRENVEFEFPKLFFNGTNSFYETKDMIVKVQLTSFPNICAVRIEHPNRRTLSNSLIFNIIREDWETKIKE